MPDLTTPTATAPAAPAWRDALLAVLAGAACYALSCLLVAPDVVAKGFGIQWQMMSEDPFALRGQLPHRLLAPLLAWLTGMGGDRYVLFTRGLAVLLLAMVWFFCRRRGARSVDAGLITLAVALTAAIQMYKEHWVGYPDPLCYALFFACMLAANRPALFWGLFFANLLNHELAAFLLPWLWFVRRRAGGSLRLDAIGAAATIGLYAGFYVLVKQLAPAPLFTAEYFASHPLFPGGTVVVWALALTHYVVAFGPVLAVLAWHQHRSEHGAERMHLWLVVAGVVAIFCIAFDWARHTNLIVVPFVIASLRFLAAGHRVAYVLLQAVGIVGSSVWWQWSATSWPTHTIVDPLMTSGMVIINPGAEPGMIDVTFGPLSLALSRWLPQVWVTVAVIGALAAAIWLVGWWLARRDLAPASVTRAV